MKIIKFLFQHTNKLKLSLLFSLGAITGLLSTYIISQVNGLINEAIEPTGANAAIYALSIVGYVCLNIIFFRGLIQASEKLMVGMKKKIFNTLLTKSNFKKVSTFRDNIYTAFSSDINIISESLVLLVHVIVSTATVISCLVYMGMLSWKLLILTFGIIIGGVSMFIMIFKIAYPQLEKARDLQDGIVSLLNQILDGFKELSIFSHKNKELEELTTANVEEVYGNKVSALTKISVTSILASTLSFCFLGILLIAFPKVFPSEREVIISFAVAFLFLIKPLEMIISLSGTLSRANIATDKIIGISKDLAVEQSTVNLLTQPLPDFKNIEIKDVKYTHERKNENFVVGPIDFRLERNELIFIYGGNGSGKTTFINSILGIYKAEMSSVSFNSKEIKPEQFRIFGQQQMAPIFSDFHLFDKFYGVDYIDKDRIEEYFKVFEINDKVKYENHGFSTTDLSMGQRKRLALISVLLEDRDILILDEWAADQDPYFRKKFYKEILPWLINEEDKTIIAITHDDQYFNVADRLYKMEYGKLKEVIREELQMMY